MMNVPVLALDDGACNIHFITHGSFYKNCSDFMKDSLLKAHNLTYEVRTVSMLDSFDSEYDNFVEMFDSLYFCEDPVKLYYDSLNGWNFREMSFQKLWDTGREF